MYCTFPPSIDFFCTKYKLDSCFYSCSITFDYVDQCVYFVTSQTDFEMASKVLLLLLLSTL